MNHYLCLTNPTRPLYCYDAVEVDCCVLDENGDVERFDPAAHPAEATPDMWSIFLHLAEGGLECVGDFTTEKAAKLVAEALRVTIYDHHIDKGVDVEYLVDPHVKSVRFWRLPEKAPEEISIRWHIDDVKSHAKELEVEISDAQCSEVLRRVREYHDATVGVNWDVLEYHIAEITGLSG